MRLSDIDKKTVRDALKTIKEKPLNRNMILVPVKVLPPEKSSGGIIIPDEEILKAYNKEGKHEKPQIERMYDTEYGVVITKSDACELPVNTGDVVRFKPLSVHRTMCEGIAAVTVSEIVDLMSNLGPYDAQEANAITKSKAKPDNAAKGKNRETAPKKALAKKKKSK